MAGIGLTQAVRGFIDGKEARYRHDELDKQRQRQARIDAANQRAAGVLNSSKQEAIAAGQDIAQWRPNDMTMLRAAQERGAAFAEAGDWEDFMRNEAALAPQRARVRGQALQRFKADGDFETFAKTAYATMPDGKDIVAVERTGGSPALPSIGREATPAAYKVKLSDGSEHEVNPDEVVKLVEQTLVDPQAVAMNEAELSFATALARIKGEEERATVRERGRISLDEVSARGEQDRTTLGTKFDYGSKLQGQKDKAALGRIDRAGKYSLEAADKGAEGPSPQDVVKRMKDTAAAFGIELSSDDLQRMGRAALKLDGGKGDGRDELRALVTKAVIDKYKTQGGESKDLGREVEDIVGSFIGVQDEAITQQRIVTARKNGEVKSLVSELRDLGYDDKKLRETGFTAVEITPTKEERAASAAKQRRDEAARIKARQDAERARQLAQAQQQAEKRRLAAGQTPAAK